MRDAIKKLLRRSVFLLMAVTVCAGAGQLLYVWAEPAETFLTKQDDAVKLSILMYHSILKDPQCAGKWTVSPAVLEEDFIYLQKNGYKTITAEQLIAYTNGEGELPEKPVMITFDDGHYNNLLYALPLLKKYNMTAIVSPIGFKIDEFSAIQDQNPMYAYLNWEDLCLLTEDGVFEIGNHTYNMHKNNGVRRAGQSVAAHREALIADVGKVQEAMQTHCGYAPKVFAYPFGNWDKESQGILREMGFCVFLTCYEHSNDITRDPACLLALGRFNRPSGISTAKFMEKALSELS